MMEATPMPAVKTLGKVLGGLLGDMMSNVSCLGQTTCDPRPAEAAETMGDDFWLAL